MIDLAAAEECAVSAVQATREHLIHQYGTLTGKRLPDRPDVYAIDEIIEKPNPTLAELRLQVPGLRAGHYLCFFGMHVLTPAVFELLDELVRRDVREAGQIQLTTALNALARREKYLALETRGTRHNLGVKFGVVEAQIALALAGVDRERMLAGLLESIVRIEQNSPDADRAPACAGRPQAIPNQVGHDDARKAPDRDDHQPRPDPARPLGPRPDRRRLDRRDPPGLRGARGVSPATPRTSTSGSGPRCSCTRSIATSSRRPPTCPPPG